MRDPVDPNSRIVGFRLDYALHKRLKLWCVAREMTLQDAFSQMVAFWLQDVQEARVLQGGKVAAGYTQLSTVPEKRP